MKFFKDRIIGAGQVILEQSAHCGMWEEPEKYKHAIMGFIKSIE